MSNKKRTTEEYIILSICAASTVCVAPFLFIRAFNGEWLIALLDLVGVLSTTLLFAYVYQTGKINFARKSLVMLLITIVVGSIVLKGAQQVVWLHPAIIGIFFLLKPKQSLTITITMTGLLGIFLWEQLNYFLIVQYTFSSLITVLFSYGFASRMLHQQRKLKDLSVKDPLTGVSNRRAMEEKLLEITEQDHLKNAPFHSLILIDLDNFKKINDQYGHGTGDNILRDFVNLLDKKLNKNNHLYRFGGEEFVVISEKCTEENGLILAEKIREFVEQHHFEQSLRVTISLGIAEYRPDETGFEWLGRADKAMYKAKNSGRNLCCVAV